MMRNVSSFLLFLPTILLAHPVVKLPAFSHEHMLKEVAKILPSNPIIIEAGSYDGSDGIYMAKLWPKGTVHSFEPVPELFENVKKNTSQFSNINPFNLALSNTTGVSEIFISKLNGNTSQSSSLLQPTGHLKFHTDISFPKSCLVSTITLDDWAQNNHISQVDFLWLDLQGVELDVIRNSNVAKNAKAIYLEVEFLEAYKNQSLYPEIKKWMTENGFKLIATDFDEEKVLQGNLSSSGYFANALFAK